MSSCRKSSSCIKSLSPERVPYTRRPLVWIVRNRNLITVIPRFGAFLGSLTINPSPVRRSWSPNTFVEAKLNKTSKMLSSHGKPIAPLRRDAGWRLKRKRTVVDLKWVITSAQTLVRHCGRSIPLESYWFAWENKAQCKESLPQEESSCFGCWTIAEQNIWSEEVWKLSISQWDNGELINTNCFIFVRDRQVFYLTLFRRALWIFFRGISAVKTSLITLEK